MQQNNTLTAIGITFVIAITLGIFLGRETVPEVVCPEFDTSEQDSLKAVVTASKQREADLWLLYEESQVTIYKLDSAFNSKSPSTQSNDAYRRLYGLPADSLADGMRAVPIPPAIEGE